MKKFLLTILYSLSSLLLYATHNRAGEITIRYISGTTYEVTITTYTKESSPADRCELGISWGDGTLDTLPRVNGAPLNGCPHYGEVLSGVDVKKNIYVGTHTYPGNGTYIVSFEDPNRNGNILNIPNSINVPFFVQTELIISGFNFGPNSSPVLLNPPIDDACIFRHYIHNPGAYDADGDSLSYELVPCRGQDGLPIPNYDIPNGVAIDPVSGDLTWDTPQQLGEYNFAIKVTEWRHGYAIGYVTRDMQITVINCNNSPPVIHAIDEICVEAGSTVQFTVTATDPDTQPDIDVVTLTATGGPLEPPNSATFPQPVSGQGSVSSLFTWNTSCDNVQIQPHQMSFRAQDNDPIVSLVDYHQVNIYVIAPAPQNLQAQPVGNTIHLSWDPDVCQEASGYKIYRREGCGDFTPDSCETGVPPYTGYSLIGTTIGLNSTTFIDDNNGAGLLHGVDYSYLVVACFPGPGGIDTLGGAQSYASDEACVELLKDVPIITQVSVLQTDVTNGQISVKWVKPTELDTAQITGPYEYRLYRSTGFNENNRTLVLSNSNPVLSLLDTDFVDTGMDTHDSAYFYQIELYNATPGNEFTVGGTEASSVFLSIAETDQQLVLSWQHNVPWDNFKYIIYKENPSLTFDSLSETTATTFTDTGLINGQTYCYYIESRGMYSSPDLPDTLINLSQIACGVPIDTVPPCPPTLSVFPNCELGQNLLIWELPSGSCDNDAIAYHVYYTPTLGGDMQLLATIYNLSDTSFLHDNLSSIAGCYALTSMDSVFNESPIMDTICVDNCPVYELPNSFSPNGDGYNDFFTPFPYHYVESIDLKIYNRWGNLVFKTTDPDIMWDGENKDTKLNCSDGVYYYICTVNEIYLQGIVPRTVTGFIELIRGK